MNTSGKGPQKNGISVRTVLIAAVVLVAAVVAGWLATKYYFSQDDLSPVSKTQTGEEAGQGKTPAPVEANTVSVRIFLPSDGGVAATVATIKAHQQPLKMAEAVLSEYLKGLREGMRDTKVIGIYRDSEGMLYVNLSDEIRRHFRGDAADEFLLLKSMHDTLASNVTGMENVKILIEGEEVESIGGHFFALYPLRETVKQGGG
jgi:hypothetical protein